MYVNKKRVINEIAKSKENLYKKKLYDSLLNMKLIKLYGTENYELEKYSKNLRNYLVLIFNRSN